MFGIRASRNNLIKDVVSMISRLYKANINNREQIPLPSLLSTFLSSPPLRSVALMPLWRSYDNAVCGCMWLNGKMHSPEPIREETTLEIQSYRESTI